MTTGMTDFIIKSGLRTPIEQIPTPDFVVPYEDPRSNLRICEFYVLAKIRAEATPIYPKKNLESSPVVS